MYNTLINEGFTKVGRYWWHEEHDSWFITTTEAYQYYLKEIDESTD